MRRRIPRAADLCLLLWLPGCIFGEKSLVAAEHSCVRQPDGSVRCWGWNYDGALGDGTQKNHDGAVVAKGVWDAVDVSVGANHSCALLEMEDGAVYCWGRMWGATPTAVPALSGAARIAAGSNRTCAILGDLSVRCVPGEGQESFEEIPELRGATQISLSRARNSRFGCARMSDGTVKCWGEDDQGQLGRGTISKERDNLPEIVPGLTGVRQVASGAWHACALLEDDTVQCWGRGLALGDGARDDRPTPGPVPGLSAVAEISAGLGHTCARLQDGSVYCWGSNSYGQAGADPKKNGIVPTPQKIEGIEDAEHLITGGGYSCAVVADGTAYCWGWNGLRQLGDGTKTSRHTPKAVLSTGRNGP